MKPKRGCFVGWLFIMIGLCSAMLFKRSRRELSIDVAEHDLGRKITKIHTSPVLVSYPEQLQYFRKRGFCFYCELIGPTRSLFQLYRGLDTHVHRQEQYA